jgi:serine/threonine protein kinase
MTQNSKNQQISGSGKTASPPQIGRYTIEGLLGRGAMGSVYKAFDPLIERTVAIKVIEVSATTAPDAVSQHESYLRFLREAQTAGALSSPYIVTIYDIGQYEDSYYIAMEYVAGGTLLQKVKQQPPMALDDVLEIICHVCEALSHAHAKGIIHRDIKPSNIMIGNDQEVKVTDFGLARFQSSPLLTQANIMSGTPHYMAPEQYSTNQIDHTVDIYAIGSVCFEMLTYRNAFPADTIPALAYRVVNEPLPKPSALNPQIPPQLDDILAKAMAKTPAARYPHCLDLERDLCQVISPAHSWHQPSRVQLDSLVSQRLRSPNQGSFTSISRADPARIGRPNWRRKKWRFLVLGGVGVALLMLGLLNIPSKRLADVAPLPAADQISPNSPSNTPANDSAMIGGGDKPVLTATEKLNATEKKYKEGFTLAQKGDYPAAIDALSEVIQFQPTHVKAYYNMGLAYKKLGNDEAALKTLATGLALLKDGRPNRPLSPEDMSTEAAFCKSLAQLYRYRNRREKALEQYNRWLELAAMARFREDFDPAKKKQFDLERLQIEKIVKELEQKQSESPQ